MNSARDGFMAPVALRGATRAERWFPDAWMFAASGVSFVALAAFGLVLQPQRRTSLQLA